jgi:hypothetical protein
MCLVGCVDTNTHFGRDYSEERRIEAYCQKDVYIVVTELAIQKTI